MRDDPPFYSKMARGPIVCHIPNEKWTLCHGQAVTVFEKKKNLLFNAHFVIKKGRTYYEMNVEVLSGNFATKMGLGGVHLFCLSLI